MNTFTQTQKDTKMRHTFVTLLFAIITLIAVPLHAQERITLPHIVSDGIPGELDNASGQTQYVWQSPLYTSDSELSGIRLTFIDSNYSQQHNGFCMVALAELHFFASDGTELTYDINNIECNSIEATEGSLEELYDNDYSTYYHSVWKYAIIDNSSEVYIDVDFQQSVSSFSFSYRTRNQNIAPTKIAITETGTLYDPSSVDVGDGDNGDDKDDEEEDVYLDGDYTPIDVLTTECLFVSLTNGGVDAYPLQSLKGEYYTKEGTLFVPLVDADTIEYPSSAYSSYGTQVPQLPYMTSYKFNNKYNANLNVDIEADTVTESMNFNVNAIGKSLTASFQLSDDRAVAYVGNKLQVSKESRNRFETPVKYAVTYPGYNMVANVKIQDEVWDYGEEIVSEIPLTAEMLYTNKPSQVGDELAHMLDNNPATVFHTVYGASYDASVIPYFTIALDSPVEVIKFYYMTRTSGNYNPMALNLYASNDNSSWKLIKGFTSSEDGLPLEPAGAEFTTPTVELGGSYRYLKIEQTASEHRNNHIVFAEFRLYSVTPGSGEAVKVQDAVYKNVKIPFGRIYTINTNWLTDSKQVPRIDIDIENGLSVTSKEYYLNANFRITGYGVYDDFVDSVQIKGRGNSTWGYSKKPYRLKFAEKVKPFGLTKGKSWVLLANAQTGAMMANAIAMKVGQLADVPYANHIIPVELYINGEYRGNYMFTEHVGFSNNSVDIDEDLGLGYMLELDSYYDEDYRFRSAYNNLPVNVKEPDLLDYDTETANAKFEVIKAEFNRVDSVLSAGGDLSSVIDLDAAARFMLVNELVMNNELGHPKSTYLWRENVTSPESKVIFGPLWDFDWAFGYEGSGSYFNIDCTESYFGSRMPSNTGRSFFSKLMNNEEFKRYYYKVWTEFNDENLIKEVVEYINDYYQFAQASFEHNATKWGDGTAYGSKIEQMQTWMQGRFEHIFANLAKYDITDLVYTLLGDIDCNNILTVHDVAILADYLLGNTAPAFNSIKADTDNSGSIDDVDILNTASAVLSAEAVDPLYVYACPKGDAVIGARPFNMVVGESVALPLLFDANDGYKAMQMDIKLPMGMLLTDATGGDVVAGKDFYYVQTGENTYRILVYSTDGTNLAQNGQFANLQLYADEIIPTEDCNIELTNILVVNSVNVEHRLDECNVKFGFGDEVVKYKLTYTVDGAVYKTFYLAYGEKITPVDEPIKEGHTFSGWSDVPATMPAEDITVQGSFSVNSYTVTFMLDGEVYQTLSVVYGTEIELPAVPEKEGYTFSGWSDVPATMPAEDIIITGSYIVDTGISVVNIDPAKDEVYNMLGQRIYDRRRLTRGIYIVNGKKLFVK